MCQDSNIRVDREFCSDRIIDFLLRVGYYMSEAETWRRRMSRRRRSRAGGGLIRVVDTLGQRGYFPLIFF